MFEMSLRKISILLLVCISFHLIIAEQDASSGAVSFVDNPSRPLRIEELEHLSKTEDGRSRLEAEFASIRGGQRMPWTVAERPENIFKNRYSDLMAFDHTRVKLKSTDESDYINANYINGYNRAKEYIATQGPFPNTTSDFWSLVHDQKVRKIVMLANLFEHGKPKVAKYWPNGTDTFGEINVTTISEIEFPELQHVVRTFAVRKGNSDPYTVRQFHFTGWPDFGVPSDKKSLLSLLDQARKYRSHYYPLLVHCSAGIGRTGTVIMTDSMLQRARAEGTVDFPKRLNNMRTQRPDVVEKKEQYVFAHEAVYDYFFDEETDEYLRKVDKIYEDFDLRCRRKEIFQRRARAGVIAG